MTRVLSSATTANSDFTTFLSQAIEDDNAIAGSADHVKKTSIPGLETPIDAFKSTFQYWYRTGIITAHSVSPQMLLLDEELTSATLQEALAFIDAYELSSSSDDQERVVSSPDVSSPGITRDGPPTRPLPRARKRPTPKNELDRLRQDVATLEETLARTKSRSLRLTEEPPASPSAAVAAAKQELAAMWMDLAVRQNRRRQQSEATNRQLKRALAKQLKVAKHLEALLARRTLEEDLEASSSAALRNFRHMQSHSSDDELLFAHLLIQSQQLYAAAETQIEHAGLHTDFLGLHTMRKQDSLYGAVYETLSSTPVPFSVQKTDAAIWNGLFEGLAKDKPVLGHVQTRDVTEDGLRKNYLTAFQHQQQTFDLHCRTVLRRYAEANRIVYTWTTTTVLASKGLRVLGQAIMVIEPSPTLPLNATVLKTLYRLREDHVDPAMLSSDRADPLMEGILKTLSGNTMTTWSWLESYLLGGAGGSAKPSCISTS